MGHGRAGLSYHENGKKAQNQNYPCDMEKAVGLEQSRVTWRLPLAARPMRQLGRSQMPAGAIAPTARWPGSFLNGKCGAGMVGMRLQTPSRCVCHSPRFIESSCRDTGA